MMQILEFRERLRAIYQKFQLFIDPAVKFIAAFIVFIVINKQIGYDARFNKLVVSFLLAVLSAFTPSAILVLLAMALALAHIYSVVPLLCFLLVFIFLILYCFFVRFTPKFGYAVLAIPVLYALHIPYAVPILLGLIATPITILPAGSGVAIYYIVKIVQDEVAVKTDIKGINDILPLFTNAIDKMIQNKQMIMNIVVFAIVITVVYVIRRLKIEYAYEIAIAAGAVTNIIAFLIVDLRLGVPKQIGAMILGTIISALIVVVIQFMRRVLDYTAVENVQFEDDDYYYYVKAVPKINVSMPNVKVKRINAQKMTENDSEDDDDELEDNDDFSNPREMDKRILEQRTREARTHHEMDRD